MFNFDRYLQELKDGAVEIGKREAADYLKEAKDDGKDFVDAMKENLQTWTTQLVEKKLSTSQFEFLVKAQKDLAEMKALTRAGLTAARIERIRVALIDLIITAAGRIV